MENDGIAKRVYVGECAGSHSVGRPRKRWINTVKDRLRRRGLYVRQAKTIVQDRSECEGKCMGCNPGYEPLTLVK